MALVVYWYDAVCFGIVAAAFIGSLWVIWRKEGASRCRDDNTIYESLVVAGLENSTDGFVHATPVAHVGSTRLWTSCWKGLHPGWLLLTRFTSFVVMAGFLSWDIVDWGGSIFVYYTEWTFALVMFYFAIGTVISAYGCWEYSNKPPSENGEMTGKFLKRDAEECTTPSSMIYREKLINGSIKLQSYYVEQEIRLRAGSWGYLMQITYQTCCGAVVLTDVVFWLVIVPFLSTSHLGLNPLMDCMHSLNAGFLLLDTFLNNLPFPWFRLAYFVLWSCIYVVFQWVIHACGFTWWPYPFLELNTPYAPVWYFLAAVLHIPCYGIYALILKAKDSILPILFPQAFIRQF